MQELHEKYSQVIKTHKGSSAGERRIRMAAQILEGAEKGEVSVEWAMQTMRRLHGSAVIE